MELCTYPCRKPIAHYSRIRAASRDAAAITLLAGQDIEYYRDPWGSTTGYCQ